MKPYSADDGDRWRKAREELRAKCCGELDASGTCFAPACRQGEALKAMDEMLEHIDSSDGERKKLETELKRVDGYDRYLEGELKKSDAAKKAPPSAMAPTDAKDAARYRWLKENHLQTGTDSWIRTGDDLEEAIDAAMAATDGSHHTKS